MVRLDVAEARLDLQDSVLPRIVDRRVPEYSIDLQLDAVGIPPDRAPIVLRIIRLLADGQPVSSDRAQVKDPEVWDDLRQLGAELDADDRIVALGGLSIRPTKHVFVVGDRKLFSWCALDTLFLPHLLGVSADVSSTCPVTGYPIRLGVSPTGVELVHPEGTVVSLVRAESKCASVDRNELFGVGGSFCSRVHFFASKLAAETWLVDKPGAVVVSPDEAFRIGQEICSLPLINAGSCNCERESNEY